MHYSEIEIKIKNRDEFQDFVVSDIFSNFLKDPNLSESSKDIIIS